MGKRSKKHSIAVFIPSIPKHWEHVEGIVQQYISGTMKPDEIVVLLSDASKVKDVEKSKFEGRYRKHNVRLVRSHRLMQAGESRQVAPDLTTSEIIAYQDSDDMPHAKRIECIDKVFSDFPNAVIMHHSYHYKKWEAPVDLKTYNAITGESIWDAHFPNGNLEDCMTHKAFGDVLPFWVHAGVPAVKREVFKKIKWKKAKALKIAPPPKEKTEDYEFSFECLYHYRERHVIASPKVYLYNG